MGAIIGVFQSLWISVKSLFDCCRSNRLKQADIENLARYLVSAKNVIVMTGAGISTNAGIPDFRSPSFGLYDRLRPYKLPYPEAVFTLDYFRRDPRAFYEIARELYPVVSSAKPTLSHYFIKLLDTKGKLLRHYTQNIDCLEDKMNMNPNKTIQAHGHIRSGHCLICKSPYPFEHMEKSVLDGGIPKCTQGSCGGAVKPDVVLFGEGLPSEFWKYLNDFPQCDLLIIMGTSLVVQPFAGLANKVDTKTPRLLINRDPVGDPTMLGSTVTWLFGLNPNFGQGQNAKRDVFLRGDCDEGCVRLARELGWESELLALRDNSPQQISSNQQQHSSPSETKRLIDEKRANV